MIIVRKLNLAVLVVFYTFAPVGLAVSVSFGDALNAATLAFLLGLSIPRDVSRLVAWRNARHQRSTSTSRERR